MTRVLVTGANGFVGRPLCEALHSSGVWVRGALRGQQPALPFADEVVSVGEIGPATEWRATLRGIDVVIHLAARVHVMRDDSTDPLTAYRTVNTQGSRKLAIQAAASGARRLVFVSTAKVVGEKSMASPDGIPQPFTEECEPRPEDAYAVSKWEGEQSLQAVAVETGLEIVMVRPPLVYGPGVRANFLALLGAVYRGLPLPLASIRNRRSLVGVGNLASFLSLCTEHPMAAGETFFVSDGEDLSTPELVRRIAHALRREPRLFRCPPPVLRAAASMTGRAGVAGRLCESFVVDPRKGRDRLGWSPPNSVDAELAATADWFLLHARKGTST